MIELGLAAAFLLVSHYGIWSTPLRAALVQRIGEKPYLAAYSLIALAAIAWLSWPTSMRPTSSSGRPRWQARSCHWWCSPSRSSCWWRA